MSWSPAVSFYQHSSLCALETIIKSCFSAHCVLWQALWTPALFILSLIQSAVTKHHPQWGGLSKTTWSCLFCFFFLFLKTFSTSNTYHCSGLIQSVRACILKTVLLQGKHANGLESSEKWIMNKITDAGWILSAICISICLWDYFSIMQAHHAHMHLLSFSSKSLIKPLKRLTLKKTHTIQLCLNSWQITQVLNLHIPLCQNITHSICHISSITGDPKKTTNYHPMSS